MNITSSVTWHHAVGTGTNVSKEPTTCILGVEDRCSSYQQSIGNSLPNHTASHSRRQYSTNSETSKICYNDTSLQRKWWAICYKPLIKYKQYSDILLCVICKKWRKSSCPSTRMSHHKLLSTGVYTKSCWTTHPPPFMSNIWSISHEAQIKSKFSQTSFT